MATLKMYCEETGLPSKKEVSDQRRELMKDSKRSTFFPLKRWPKDIQTTFWKTPTGNKETFGLAVFLIGNGCAPQPFTEWILLAQHWAESPQNKPAK